MSTVDSEARALAGTVTRAVRALAELPPRPERDAGQQHAAQAIHADRRRARADFAGRYAGEVYDELTTRRTRYLRLSDLVSLTAQRFPGVVPGPDELAAESGRRQADKEGYEIDQALFVRALLRDTGIGAHLMAAMRRPTPRAVELLPGFRTSGRADLCAATVERDGALAHLTVTNTGCLNAEDVALVAALECAVDLALLDPAVHAVVLRGGEMTHPRHLGRRVFSAGVNLVDLYAGRLSYLDFLMTRELGVVSKLLHGLSEPEVSKPWVAAVDGFAIGGGMQLLLVADRVVAADDAYFSLPAAQEGIVPGAANLRLTRFAGARLARRIILAGQRVPATAPEARLICDEVVSPAEVGRVAVEAARSLASHAVAANRRMLALAEEPPDALRAYLAEFAYVQADRLYSADVLEKVARFADRSGTRV